MAESPSLRSSAGAPPIRPVFVVDDHAAYRRALGSVIELTPGARWCGEAASGADAVRQLAGRTDDDDPDLVIMDVNLGDTSGIALTRQLLADRAHLRILLVSTLTEDDLPADVATCGAVGFVRKDRFGPAALTEVLDAGN